MKTKMIPFCCLVVLAAMVGIVHAASWQACGVISNIDPLTCQIPGQSLAQVEYGIAYNTFEPVPVVCTTWNVGVRIANKTPYFIESDDPLAGMRYGGFVFYQNTNAGDDEACAGGYRHQYWRLTTDNLVEIIGGNGCGFGDVVYCRAH
jgi:hypothetical protein